MQSTSETMKKEHKPLRVWILVCRGEGGHGDSCRYPDHFITRREAQEFKSGEGGPHMKRMRVVELIERKREMSRQASCRSCGAPILWVRTKKNKSMPLDPKPTEAGSIIIRMGPRIGQETAIIETKDQREQRLKCHDPSGRTAFMPHWATCPTPEQHRKRIRR